MCCRSGADTRLIHCSHGEMRKQCAIRATTDLTAPLSPEYLDHNLDPTENSKWLIPSIPAWGRWGANLFINTCKGQNPRSWIEGFFSGSDFVTADWHYHFKQPCWDFQCAAKRTHVTYIFIWAKGHDVADMGCEVLNFIQRVLLLPRSKGGLDRCVCVCVCAWVLKATKRLINTYSSHWFPVAACVHTVFCSQ